MKNHRYITIWDNTNVNVQVINLDESTHTAHISLVGRLNEHPNDFWLFSLSYSNP